MGRQILSRRAAIPSHHFQSGMARPRFRTKPVQVTGQSRDDWQSVIKAVQARDFAVALQFQNFRD